MKTQNNNAVLQPSIFFATLESEDGERTLKQHGYTEAMRGAWYADKYEGNKQLCNKKGGIHDGDKFVSMNEINAETIDRDRCCKKCLRIYDFQCGLDKQKQQNKNEETQHQL